MSNVDEKIETKLSYDGLVQRIVDVTWQWPDACTDGKLGFLRYFGEVSDPGVEWKSLPAGTVFTCIHNGDTRWVITDPSPEDGLHRWLSLKTGDKGRSGCHLVPDLRTEDGERFGDGKPKLTPFTSNGHSLAKYAVEMIRRHHPHCADEWLEQVEITVTKESVGRPVGSAGQIVKLYRGSVGVVSDDGCVNRFIDRTHSSIPQRAGSRTSETPAFHEAEPVLADSIIDVICPTPAVDAKYMLLVDESQLRAIHCGIGRVTDLPLERYGAERRDVTRMWDHLNEQFGHNNRATGVYANKDAS